MNPLSPYIYTTGRSFTTSQSQLVLHGCITCWKWVAMMCLRCKAFSRMQRSCGCPILGSTTRSTNTGSTQTRWDWLLLLLPRCSALLIHAILRSCDLTISSGMT
jgi:hypothetical protein